LLFGKYNQAQEIVIAQYQVKLDPSFRKDSSANPWNPRESGVDTCVRFHAIPLYLEITTDESIEDAVDKADFGEV
jgi:hypothetical protein